MACRVLSAALVVATGAVFAFTSRYHEFWRDETQAALIARAVPLDRLVPAMRTEAVPPVLFLVLKAIRWLPVPYSISVLAPVGYASLLFGTYRLLRSISRSRARSLGLTVALALTDTYFYELGVVVRQYGLGLGFALASFGYLADALRTRRRQDAFLGALFGALAVSTAVHPGCVAGAALVSYSLVRLAQDRAWRTVVEPLCALPAFLFTFFLIGPYDRAPESVAVRHPPVLDAMERAGKVLADGLVCRGWWTGWQYLYAIDAPRLFAMVTMVLAMVGLAFARLHGAARRPARAAFFASTLVLGAVALSYIFVVRYESAYRHHLFLTMPTLVAGLGALAARRPAAEGHGTPRAVRAALAALTLPWFGYQYAVCATDLARDGREAFSAAKAASTLFPPGARVVIAGDDWIASGILYYRPDLAMRATTSLGRPLHYLIADWHWHDEVPLVPVLADECRASERAPIYVIAREAAPSSIAACTRFVAAPPTHLPTERFRVYELPCDCPAVADGR